MLIRLKEHFLRPYGPIYALAEPSNHTHKKAPLYWRGLICFKDDNALNKMHDYDSIFLTTHLNNKDASGHPPSGRDCLDSILTVSTTFSFCAQKLDASMYAFFCRVFELVNPVSPVCTTLKESDPSGIIPVLEAQAVNNKEDKQIHIR